MHFHGNNVVCCIFGCNNHEDKWDANGICVKIIMGIRFGTGF